MRSCSAQASLTYQLQTRHTCSRFLRYHNTHHDTPNHHERAPYILGGRDQVTSARLCLRKPQCASQAHEKVDGACAAKEHPTL